MTVGAVRDEPVGVLGGLGPAATVLFMRRLVELTDAPRDQDHVDLLVWQHGSIPDRSAFLLANWSRFPVRRQEFVVPILEQLQTGRAPSHPPV